MSRVGTRSLLHARASLLYIIIIYVHLRAALLRGSEFLDVTCNVFQVLPVTYHRLFTASRFTHPAEKLKHRDVRFDHAILMKHD